MTRTILVALSFLFPAALNSTHAAAQEIATDRGAAQREVSEDPGPPQLTEPNKSTVVRSRGSIATDVPETLCDISPPCPEGCLEIAGRSKCEVTPNSLVPHR
jgi:hypothetical protein